MAETWDEDKPAGSRSPALGDDDIREFKRAVRERLAEDHNFSATESPAFGASDYKIGKHDFVTLVQRNTSKTTQSDEVSFVCKSVSGNPEVPLTPPSGGTDRQLTKNSGANLNLNSGDFANRIIPVNALDTGSVDAAAMGSFSVSTAALQTGFVGNDNMADNAIDTAELVDLSVTNAKLASDAVGADKMSHGLSQVWTGTGVLFQNTTDSWGTLTSGTYTAETRIKIPTGRTYLRLYAHIIDYQSYEGQIRLNVDGVTSTAVDAPGAWAWTNCGTVNCSGRTVGSVVAVQIQGIRISMQAFAVWWE